MLFFCLTGPTKRCTGQGGQAALPVNLSFGERGAIVRWRASLTLGVIGIALMSAVARAGDKDAPPPRLTSTRDLAQYVGTYPCSNGLLKQPVLLDTLKKTLGPDYDAYREHMQLSGCGAIERRDGFLFLDVSQLHVGGYSSLIFVRLSDGELFVFWLKSTVADKQWQLYGPRPIPETIIHAV